MSPDFRHQFLTHKEPLPDAAIITHIHFDHLDGLGNAFRLFNALPVYAANQTDPVTGESVAETIREKYYYLDRIDVVGVKPFSQVQICGLQVEFVPVDHPPLVSYGLVITDLTEGTKLVVTGDTSYDISDDARAAFADPDLLLADAIVPASVCDRHPAGGSDYSSDGVPFTFGNKHMTREGALSLAEELGAMDTRLVHAAHYYPVDEAFCSPLTIDGERITL
jgi:phosphoribosyl 1,2-cyclic phosphate phosphodiesterase